jgi:hypothetical protein
MTVSEILALLVGGYAGYRLALILGARKRIPGRRAPRRPATVRILHGSEWVITDAEFARLRAQGLL